MSNSPIPKNSIQNIDYEKNLQKLLGWEDLEGKVLKKSAGILKNILKKTGLSYQKEIRGEWEKRARKLEKRTKK